MTQRLLLTLFLALSLTFASLAAPVAQAAVKHAAAHGAKAPVKKAAPRRETRKAATRTKAKTKTTAEDKAAKTEAALREQTDGFVALIDGGKQSLTDAQIAWKAKHPDVACQRARTAKTRFVKARVTLDGLVATASDGKADAAPFKSLYPKINELDETTARLIGMTCN
jgi:hypothetical protein